MKRVFLFLLFFSTLFAEGELQDIFDLELSHGKVMDARENFFLTEADYRIAPKTLIATQTNKNHTDMLQESKI